MNPEYSILLVFYVRIIFFFFRKVICTQFSFIYNFTIYLQNVQFHIGRHQMSSIYLYIDPTGRIFFMRYIEIGMDVQVKARPIGATVLRLGTMECFISKRSGPRGILCGDTVLKPQMKLLSLSSLADTISQKIENMFSDGMDSRSKR